MPQFTLSLLQLVGRDHGADRAALGIRLQAAIYFKNHVLRFWVRPRGDAAGMAARCGREPRAQDKTDRGSALRAAGLGGGED